MNSRKAIVWTKKVHASPGSNIIPRGKKSCPECHAPVGPRLRKCECGHEFEFKSGVSKASRVERVEKPHKNLTENASEVIGIRDREALDSFIDQLNRCRSDSVQRGGCYSAFLHHEHGVVRVEVWLSPRP